MALTEQVALILTANDKSQATFTTFIRGMSGVGNSYKSTAAATTALANANRILVVDQDKVATATARTTLATMRDAQAKSQAATAQLIYTRAMDQANAQQAKAISGTIAAEAATKNTARSYASLQASLIKVTLAQKAYADSLDAISAAEARAISAGDALASSKLRQQAASVGYKVANERQALISSQVTPIGTSKGKPVYSPEDQIALDTALKSRTTASKALYDANVALAESEDRLVKAQAGVGVAEDARRASITAMGDATRVATEAQVGLSQAIAAGAGPLNTAIVDTDLLAEANIAAAKANDTNTASKIRQATAAGVLATAEKKEAEARLGTLQRDPNFIPPAAGMLARVGPLAGLAAGATAILVGIDASRKALAFDAAENQIVAQTTATISQVKAAGNIVLGFAASQQSQFDPTTLIKGALLPLTQGLPASTVAAVLPLLAKQSAIIKAPDLTLSGQGLVSISGYAGTGSKTTVAEATSYIDMITAAEKRIPAPPAAFTSALPKLLASTYGSGISLPNIFGAEVQGVRATGATPSVMAGWIGQLVRSSIIKPTPAAISLSKKLGFDLGAKGLAEAGNNPFVYWSNIYAAVGGDTNKLGSLMGATPAEIKAQMSLTPTQLSSQLISGGGGGSGINALRAFMALNKPGSMQGAAALSDIFSSSGGATGTANQELLQGQQQKLTALQERFNADLTKIGLKINEFILPALIALGSGALDAADKLVNIAGDFGSWLDKHLPAGMKTTDVLTGGVAGGYMLHLLNDYLNRGKGSGAPIIAGHSGSSQTASILGLTPLGIPFQPSEYGSNPTYTAQLNRSTQVIMGNILTNVSEEAGVLFHNIGNLIKPPPPTKFLSGGIQAYDPLYKLPTGETPTLYKQNLFTTPGSSQVQAILLRDIDRSAQVVEKYKVLVAKLNQAIKDGADSGSLDKLRDQILALLKDPSLAIGLQPGALVKMISSGGNVTRAVQKVEDARSYVAVGYAQANALFKADVQAGKGASVLKPLADYIKSLMQDPIFARLHPKNLAATITAEAGTLTHDITLATNRDNLLAANTSLMAANIFYQGVQIHHGSLQSLNASAYGVYNASIKLAQTQNKIKPDALTLKDSTDKAALTLEQSLLANIQGPMSEAQAGLTLAQDLGKSTAGYVAQLKTFYAIKDKGSPNQFALDVYNLTQATMKAPLPGPQLIRPNVAGLGSLDAVFSGSISRLSTTKDRGESQRIAQLELALAQRDKEIAFLRDLLGEQRKGTAALQSIDRKTEPPPKGTGQRSSLSGLGNLRIPA